MAPRANKNQGFSLIEVVVALAIIAILAGAIAPLVLKGLNQAREQRTRSDLRTAYEALFGARDRRVSNMRADFGYNGTGSLSQMTTQGAIRPYGPYPAQPALTGGWNGPYWMGMQSILGLPEDAWGRPFQLRFIGGGYQLLSLGENGVLNSPGQNPQGDDLVYPLPPNPLPWTTVNVNVQRAGGPPPKPGSVTAVAYTPGSNNPVTITLFYKTGIYTGLVPSGTAVITVTLKGGGGGGGGGGSQTQSQAVDLIQGGTVTLNFYF